LNLVSEANARRGNMNDADALAAAPTNCRLDMHFIC
jgi:hypothetical protein